MKTKDLLKNYPELIAEWNYEKNDKEGINPDMISVGSSRRVWWRCKEGHESYIASLAHRVYGTGCPLCGNKKISEKFCKPVDQFTKDGVFIQTFASVKLAAEACRVSSGAIGNAIRGKAKTSGGFIWKLHKN